MPNSRLVLAMLSLVRGFVEDYADEWYTPPSGRWGIPLASQVPPVAVKQTPPLGYQPNFVFILTDDQDTRLGRHDYTDIGSLELMPKLQEHLMNGGARLTNAFVNTPICCPSRTEFFSGRYYHNVAPPSVEGSCMHADTTQAAKKATGLFGLLVTAGYEVGVFGKVTNDQQDMLDLMTKEGSATLIDSPLQYNNFNGLTYYHDFGNGTTYNETLDKKAPVYGTVYQTTQLGNRSLDWLDALQADEERRNKPFYLYLGPHAPHFPAQPAPWYEHAFDDVTIPITPNYNLSSPEKAQHVRQNPAFTETVKCWEDQHFRDRWASLLSVDDIIDALVTKLEKLGKLDETFIFYSSDHGYKQGQWRIGTSKQHPYETDIRVPFLIRGPGISAGSTPEQLTANIDLLPTMLDLAGVKIPDFIDGRSMVPWLVRQDVLVESRRTDIAAPWRNQLLNEYLSVGTYYNDHGHIWSDGTVAAKCGGEAPTGPAGTSEQTGNCVESEGVGDGNCYFVDSEHSNSWRALRILTNEENLQYVEYDPTWTWNTTDDTGAGLQHYELYDIARDPYQMTNIYGQASDAKRRSLHAAISKYYACKGVACREADRAESNSDAEHGPPSELLV